MPTPRIDYADVQGTILRGYRVDLARHFILSVTDAAGARAFIQHLVDGTGGVPRITTAARWTQKPECFVNIGITCTGLAALGVSAADLATFDRAFQRGAASDGDGEPKSAMWAKARRPTGSAGSATVRACTSCSTCGCARTPPCWRR